MHADHHNKKKFFNIIKKIRSGKQSKPPNILITPSGTYHGDDTLEGFTADAEALGQAVGEASQFDN